MQGGRSKIFLCVEIFQLDQIAYIINIYIDTYKISACVGAGNFNNHYQQNDNVVAAPSPHTLRHHVAETDNARTRLRTSGGWSGWVWRRRRRSTQHTTFNADSSGPCQILVLPRRQLELQIEINDAQAYAAEPSGKKNKLQNMRAGCSNVASTYGGFPRPAGRATNDAKNCSRLPPARH